MIFGYIDKTKKYNILNSKPEVHIFTTGAKFYIFPGAGNKRRLERSIKKTGAEIITDEISLEFRKKVYLKIILLALKETGAKEVTLSFENPLLYIDILQELIRKEILFSLTASEKASVLSEYFLELTGFPVKIIHRIKDGLFIFEKKTNIICDKQVYLLDIANNPNLEFLIKNTHFPIKITSLQILQAALLLTEKNIEDIIIKLCINRTDTE